MNCSVTLTAEEFKTLHNALCSLSYMDNDKVNEQVKVIRGALRGAYDQERKDFDRRSTHYDEVRNSLGLTAIWSMYEIDNLSERYPFKDVDTVTYKDHWGKEPVVTPIIGCTWAALYVAANACIRDSSDSHHCYIENFKQVGNTLILTTGS